MYLTPNLRAPRALLHMPALSPFTPTYSFSSVSSLPLSFPTSIHPHAFPLLPRILPAPSPPAFCLLLYLCHLRLAAPTYNTLFFPSSPSGHFAYFAAFPLSPPSGRGGHFNVIGQFSGDAAPPTPMLETDSVETPFYTSVCISSC